MAQSLIILGSGGHARVLIDALRQRGDVSISGIVDPNKPVGSIGPFDLSVLGDDEAVFSFSPDQVRLVNGVGSAGSMERRNEVFRRFSSRGYEFAEVVHPSAVVSPSVMLGEGAQLMAGSVVQCGANIGRNTIVNTRASVDHDCRIGVSVHVAPGVTLSGAVTVGDRTHIGTGATVIQGISIGADSLIAAGAVVYRDIPNGTRYLGQ